ncbi:homeobox protein MOX-2-like [Lucilia cuprina]|uniref:homeobox protein MOX-2-like n=1 Tax=Lucilia cuprina TaxID=7375 RepID=UPI001F060FDB|nr:homeobox protein MOX-2-like [Lucilia cuprina]
MQQHQHHLHHHHHHHQQQHQQQQHLAHQPTATTTIMPLFSHHQQGTLLRLSPLYINSSGGLGSGLGCSNRSRTPSHQYISNPELTFDIGSRTCLSRSRCRQESTCRIL